jgi:hypothetical protein
MDDTCEEPYFEDLDEEDEDKRVEKLNQNTQYMLHGNGYVTTGPVNTAPKLPKGTYRVGRIGMLMGFIPNPIETDNLIKINDSATELVLSEIDKFWGIKSDFDRFGYVHKRGFLLHGPQGSGKTSTINLICNEIADRDGIAILAEHPTMVVNQLEGLREVEPDRKIVVIMEDIDQIMENRGEEEVLALLDGHKSINGVVYIATTNYINQLSPRIKNRPSRFDRVINLGTPSEDFRYAYLKSRDLGLDDAAYHKWAKDTEGFSIAHLKEVIIGVMILKGDYTEVIDRVRKMYDESDSSGE